MARQADRIEQQHIMNPTSSSFACIASPVAARALDGTRSARPIARRGFTLVEVLATLLLMAIALPAIQQGLMMTTRAAVVSQQRSLAAALAEAKLNELSATTLRTPGTSLQLPATSGTFPAELNGSPSPFSWDAEVNTWAQNMGVPASNTLYELDVHVTWLEAGLQRSTTASTLIYVSANTSTSASSSGTGGT
ncbi:MAG TPA: type II secretion system protein [Tepidisphaeraceae bacterium]|jgi:prepilin-type N-terminal cleavage/methylation domain-containing protein|nr:type II secretion system protein [Tepidisphaeraceae bacterium]